MKLIGSLASPYTRKVRIVLAEKKIDFDFEIDDPWKADAKAAKLNPLGKVPALLLDDGRTLFDSRVIVGFPRVVDLEVVVDFLFRENDAHLARVGAGEGAEKLHFG